MPAHRIGAAFQFDQVERLEPGQRAAPATQEMPDPPESPPRFVIVVRGDSRHGGSPPWVTVSGFLADGGQFEEIAQFGARRAIWINFRVADAAGADASGATAPVRVWSATPVSSG
ncbi:hypothetical protein [Amycolatopsis sp. cg9]|uniref:hypothetical protein n=1 Tax=Amycolatopsis sp. cg9 TaxID=3238801 RepID=UPI003525D6BD